MACFLGSNAFWVCKLVWQCLPARCSAAKTNPPKAGLKYFPPAVNLIFDYSKFICRPNDLQRLTNALLDDVDRSRVCTPTPDAPKKFEDEGFEKKLGTFPIEQAAIAQATVSSASIVNYIRFPETEMEMSFKNSLIFKFRQEREKFIDKRKYA